MDANNSAKTGVRLAALASLSLAAVKLSYNNEIPNVETVQIQEKAAPLKTNDFIYCNDFIEPEISTDNNVPVEGIPQTFTSEMSAEPVFQIAPTFSTVPEVDATQTPQMPIQINDPTCLISFPVNRDDLMVSLNSPMQVFQGVVNYPQTTTAGLISVIPSMMQPIIEDQSMQMNPIQIIPNYINYPSNEIQSYIDPSMQIYQGVIQPGDYGNMLAIQPVYSNPTIQQIFLS